MEPAIVAADEHVDIGRARFARIVEQVGDGLADHRIGDDAGIVVRAKVAAQRHAGIGAAPVAGDGIDKVADIGDLRRFAARFARRHQDARQDRLAAFDGGFHLADFLDQRGVAGDFGHVAPVAQHHGQLGERRAQLMRGARCEQAHADDMFLLRRLLA